VLVLPALHPQAAVPPALVLALARPEQLQALPASFAALLAQPAWRPSLQKKLGKQDSGATPNAGRSSGDANVLQQTSDPSSLTQWKGQRKLCNAGALYTRASGAGKTRIVKLISIPHTIDNSRA
jgi:hypothetical protein